MREIVVISGKGGTGKTSVLAGLAGLGPPKVLADCDVDAADLHLIMQPEVRSTHDFHSGELAVIDPDLCTECGLCLEHCRFGAISEDLRVVKESCEGCALCYHVCPEGAIRMQERHCGQWYESTTRFGPMIHANLGIGEENSGKLVSLVRHEAHRAAQEQGYGLVLADGAPGIGCPVIASLTNADLALLVAEPTVSAISDLKRVSELVRHFGIPAQAIVNKVDVNPDLAGEIEEFCREWSLPVAGRLPFDRGFIQAQIRSRSVVEHDPDGLGRIMRDIWARIEANM
jgi:MinD superfamily P-loop ATPase